MNHFKSFIIIIVSVCTMASCKQEIENSALEPLSQYERTVQVVKDKIKEVKQKPTYSSYKLGQVQDCEIDGDREGCITWTHPLNIFVDLTECSTSVSDSCEVFAEMEITLCMGSLNAPGAGDNIEVNFKESVWGHSLDCVTGVDHTDDWDCILEKTYLKFVDYMMPIILQQWGQNSLCDGGYDTFLSRYTKELCVYPCTVRRGKWFMVSLEQCGESTACCKKEDLWCVDSNGNVQVTPGEKIQIGECTKGGVPCITTKEQVGWPWLEVWKNCRPRDCVGASIILP